MVYRQLRGMTVGSEPPYALVTEVLPYVVVTYVGDVPGISIEPPVAHVKSLVPSGAT
jgi:hypothetical protein